MQGSDKAIRGYKYFAQYICAVMATPAPQFSLLRCVSHHHHFLLLARSRSPRLEGGCWQMVAGGGISNANLTLKQLEMAGHLRAFWRGAVSLALKLTRKMGSNRRYQSSGACASHSSKSMRRAFHCARSCDKADDSDILPSITRRSRSRSSDDVQREHGIVPLAINH